MLLLTGAALIDLLFAVPGVQVFVDLEPVELQLLPKLLAFLVHDVLDAVILLSFLLDVFVFLVFDVLVGLLTVPEVVDFFDLELSCLLFLLLLVDQLLDRLLQLFFELCVSQELGFGGLSGVVLCEPLLGLIDEVVLDLVF